MSLKFMVPDLSDKRILYASNYLKTAGYETSEKIEQCQFILLGVNPKNIHRVNDSRLPVFAGNVSGESIYDYTKSETFAIDNAYLTAEGAVALATENSDQSLIHSSVLITGYGRIGKALQKYLSVYTRDITVCARNPHQRAVAQNNNCDVIDFNELNNCTQYDFIFNTVPHPVFNAKELSTVREDALLMDLASFPGGVDVHLTDFYGIHFLTARGLPSKYSPKSAGYIVGRTVDEMIQNHPDLIRR